MKTKSLYREYLHRVLDERCQRNPRYSLRSFARDLGLSAPRLSGVLNGKFGLSRAAAEALSAKLPMSAAEREWFCDSVEAEHSRSPARRKIARERIETTHAKVRPLGEEKFRVVSDWYHFAIMELTETGVYAREDAPRISRRLGISVREAESALKRLVEYDLLRARADGTLECTGSFFANPEGIPSEAIRKHQVQLLKRAEVAVQTQTVEEREIRSLTVALSPDQVIELKKLVGDFQAKVQARAKADGSTKREVYALAMQLFRLSEKESSV